MPVDSFARALVAGAKVQAAANNYYSTIAAGVAATPVGSFFASAESGTTRIYQRTGTTPFYVDQGDAAAPLTKALLAAAGGAALVGATGGGTVQQYIDGPLPSYTFANRPDPAGYLNKPGIVITDERYGIAICYSDGTRWRRRTDGRTAQSAVINYYIDGTSGNDSNAGTTSGAPIKTLTQLKTLVAALPAYRRSGLWFAFKRGSTYGTAHGFWTLDANNFGCRFWPYGTASGARPAFDCADTLANGSFTVDATYTNSYNITISPSIETAPAEVPGVWVNGERFSYVSSKAACDASPFTFYHPTADGQTSLVLTVNPGSNPATDSKLYEASIRSHAISALAADECEFKDLYGKRPYGSYGPFVMGNAGIAQGILSEDGNSHNIYYGPNCVLRDCEALNCNPGAQSSATMFIGFANPLPSDATANIENCRARMTVNSLKPKSAITAVGLTSPMTVTVSNGHLFAVGDYVTSTGAGGSTWLNAVRWYVSAVSGNQLTLQKHDYTSNRVLNFDARTQAAWTSGGYINMAPSACTNITGFYNHGPGDGSAQWERVTYYRCESHGCSTTFSAADAKLVEVVEPYCTQFFIGPTVISYTRMIVRDGFHDNTPAVVSAIGGKADGGDLSIKGGTYTINSTGNFQVSTAGTKFTLYNVNCVGFSSLVRGLAANLTIDLKRVVNTPNSNVAQANLYNFSSACTGLSLASDFNNFGGYAGGFTITGTAYTALSDYQAATLQDLNSKA